MPLEATPLSGVPVAILAQAESRLSTSGMSKLNVRMKSTEVLIEMKKHMRKFTWAHDNMNGLCFWTSRVDYALNKLMDDQFMAPKKQLRALEKCTHKMILSTKNLEVEVSRFLAEVKAMKGALDTAKLILPTQTIRKLRKRSWTGHCTEQAGILYQPFKLSKLAMMGTRSQRRQEIPDRRRVRLLPVLSGGRVCVRCGCFEVFQQTTEQCCWTQREEHCRFHPTIASQ